MDAKTKSFMNGLVSTGRVGVFWSLNGINVAGILGKLYRPPLSSAWIIQGRNQGTVGYILESDTVLIASKRSFHIVLDATKRVLGPGRVSRRALARARAQWSGSTQP